MLKVALTGGIASGKSEVANAFSQLGAALIDTDVLARAATAAGSEGLQTIVQSFGEQYLDERNQLDRAQLRRHVFASREDRKRLEAIVHPLVLRALREQLAGLDAAYVIIAVPLLIETGMQRDTDRVLVVDCDEALQIKRLRERDGETGDSARAIVATQSDRATRLAAADDIITNDGDLGALQREVQKLHKRYLKLADR